MRRSYHGYAKTGSTLDGYNFNNYPIHKFVHLNVPEINYPVYPLVIGTDTWHCECFRERKNSDIFAIEYVTEGIFIFNQNGMEYHCHPGDVYLLHYSNNSTMRCESTIAVKKTVILSGSLLMPILVQLGLDKVTVISLKEREKIDFLFQELMNEVELSVNVSGRLSELSYAVLMTLAEQLIIASHPKELRKALKFIQNSLHSTLSLTELAQYANVSKATLNRLFQEYMHCSPINYYIEQKFAAAQQLLRFYTVKQVANIMNFSSAQYFSKEFKKHFGVSPKHFPAAH